MLNATEMNYLLEQLYGVLKERIPKLRPTTVSSIEGIRSVGTYGPLIMGGLFVGGVEGKVTVILEWETALKLVAKIQKVPKVEVLNEDGQLALEEVVKISLERLAVKLSETHGKTELYLLPTLTDANVLLAMHRSADVVRIGIQTLWEPIQVFFAFPEQVKTKAVANAA